MLGFAPSSSWMLAGLALVFLVATTLRWLGD
jgi:hypothetical protein